MLLCFGMVAVQARGALLVFGAFVFRGKGVRLAPIACLAVGPSGPPRSLLVATNAWAYLRGRLRQPSLVFATAALFDAALLSAWAR